MLKFIIVEDDEENQTRIKQLLVKISIQRNEEYNIVCFKKYCPELDKEINDVSCHKIYIMDIELKNSISGIEIAEKIREEDWDNEIIFVTNHDSLFEKAHREILDVFDFIERFINMENRLEIDIIKILKKKYDNKILKLTGTNIFADLHLKNILYIEKVGRKSVIHAYGNEYKTNLSLDKLLEELDYRFVRIHKGCIANKERIVEHNFSKGYFMLDTGEKVFLLSQKYKKEEEVEC